MIDDLPIVEVGDLEKLEKEEQEINNMRMTVKTTGGVECASNDEMKDNSSNKNVTGSIIGEHTCLSMRPPPDTTAMKQERKQNTVGIGLASGVTGLLLGGPIVGVAAGVISSMVYKKTMKKKEKKVIENYKRELAEMLSPKT